MSTPLAQLADRYFQASYQQFPILATSLGLHDHDARLGDYSAAALHAYADAVRARQRELAQLAPATLSLTERSDYQLLAANMEEAWLDIEQIKDWQRQPQMYADVAVYGVFMLVSREFSTLAGRLRDATARLREIPALLELGKQQVQNPPPIYTETAIEAANGAASFFRTMSSFAAGLGDDDTSLHNELLDSAEQAARAMDDYVAWLKSELMPHSQGSFAIGAELFARKIQLQHMIDASPAAIAAWGEEMYARTLQQLQQLAAQIDPAQDWHAIIAATRREHPTAARLLDAYRAETTKLITFIQQNNLVTIPKGDLQIVETPPFQRATYAFAGYANPGAFDAVQTGQFWVTPVEPDATAEQQERQLEEHAWAWIPVIALHEGYPGHHLQLLRANQASTPIRKHLGFSSLFVEGWALYCEQMMGELGYYTDPRVQLSQLRGQLWRAARVVIDVGLQSGTMSVDEAIAMLSDGVRFSPAAARGEVRRYTMTPSQPMSYLLGKRQILALRDEAQATWGDRFTLQRFHDKLLASGSIPVKLVRDEFWADNDMVYNGLTSREEQTNGSSGAASRANCCSSLSMSRAVRHRQLRFTIKLLTKSAHCVVRVRSETALCLR